MQYLLLALFYLAPLITQADEIPLERQLELRYLLHQDCGSCHGMTLRGGLGPSLLPEALTGKSMAFLTQTILYGRSGTAMPPWKLFLQKDEATWLATYLKKEKSRGEMQ